MPVYIEQASVIVSILLLVFFAQVLKEIGIPSLGLTQSLLLYTGYLLSSGGLLFGVGIILSIFLGSICGAYLIFYLARCGGNKLLSKLGSYVFISSETMEKTRNLINTYSFMTISIGRFIPGLMAPTTIVAGTLKMPIGRFFMGIVFQLSLWMAILLILGGTFSHFTPQIDFSPNRFFLPLAAFIFLVTLASILYRNKIRQSHKV
jgi:membrane protein DedA with SNARE-associated domain